MAAFSLGTSRVIRAASSAVVGTFAGNWIPTGSCTSSNVVGPDVKDWSTFWLWIDPWKWNVYFPTVVGKKEASYSPGVPRPVSGSNEGSSASGMLLPPTSTSTFRPFPRSATGFPPVARKNCTKFSWPR